MQRISISDLLSAGMDPSDSVPKAPTDLGPSQAPADSRLGQFAGAPSYDELAMEFTKMFLEHAALRREAKGLANAGLALLASFDAYFERAPAVISYVLETHVVGNPADISMLTERVLKGLKGLQTELNIK
jgi:hypothetical protein